MSCIGTRALSVLLLPFLLPVRQSASPAIVSAHSSSVATTSSQRACSPLSSTRDQARESTSVSLYAITRHASTCRKWYPGTDRSLEVATGTDEDRPKRTSLQIPPVTHPSTESPLSLTLS
ncbi:uncharacterized protein PHACADRAFT_264018 [Phanerochaete carnosa HHB-10118-sp]|uniref:Secreted protein n=1 Tax=Phanerochaete carnosa (strain HHB-10118-sp) TaxID=650164 RepID=K5VHC7_PHACS|nr:uncharacterized protein PHACADRAFT_264018 [Phanerochaete carnosa HHB-10118-sp]EKM50638.1 hypothetical protein PHACADRAFT_264018 [Phanerochaete carnosa HHB-10118-sp]